MLKDVDYLVLRDELSQIYTSPKIDDKIEVAYHYGNFGFNSIAIKYLREVGADPWHINRHLNQMDSVYNDYPSSIRDYSQEFTTNHDLSKLKTFQILCKNYDNHNREAGLYIHLLPYIEVLRTKYGIETVYFDCNSRLADFFAKYFPHVKIGTADTVVSMHDVINEVTKLGGPSLLRTEIIKISKMIRGNATPEYVGINWFANTLLERYRSIPIGTLINTIGIHKTDYKVMSLQYNDPAEEINIYNRYAKNKITEVFYNDINTSILDIVEAVAKCKMFIGIQSEACVIAFSLLGIPTIVTAGSPLMYWYFENQLNPYIKCARMRFAGDQDWVTRTINKFL